MKNMRINKNKLNFLVYILIFCVAIAAIGGYYLGISLTDYTFVEVSPSTDEVVNIIDLNNLEKELDSNMDMVTMELNNLLAFLNSSSNTYENESCGLLKSLTISNGNILNVIAPYYYACNNNIKYTSLGNLRLMSSTDYQEYQEYFNASLVSADSVIDEGEGYYGENYYLAYEVKDIAANNFYELKDIIKENNKYIANIAITNKNNNNKQNGKITISIKDNHVFYEAFTIN